MTKNEFIAAVSEWIMRNTPNTRGVSEKIYLFELAYDNLQKGITHFYFTKKDGTRRSAYGTLSTDIIKRHNGIPKNKRDDDSYINGAISYFDLEKDAWRCFKANSIVEVDLEYGEDFS